MHEIDKIDAFSLIVKAMERGDELEANRIMQIIIKAIRNSTSQNSSNTIVFDNERDVLILQELLSKLSED